MKMLSKILWAITLVLWIINGIYTGNKVYFIVALYVLCIIIFENLNDKLSKLKDENIELLRKWSNTLAEENIKLRNKLSIYKVYLEIIKVPQSFKEHPPAVSKLSERFNYYDKHKEFKVPIVVDDDLNLVDGYTSYLIAKKRKIDIVEVKVKEKNNEL